MAAGYACLNEVAQPGIYQTLTGLTERLAQGLLHAAQAEGVPLVVNHVGGMFGLFFTDAPARDLLPGTSWPAISTASSGFSI